MASPLARLHVQYDDGYFDKDEQGWCASNVRIHVADGVVHVDQWGDANGARPYAYAWEGRIAEVDEANEIILITRGNDTLVFDLRSQRLLGSGGHVQESVPLLVPPAHETAAYFGTRMQALFEHAGSIEVIARDGIFHGLDVSSGTHRYTARWRDDPRLSLSISGHVESAALRNFRQRLRAWKAPLLARPSLVLRALIAEAKEVGSYLSALDHGAGAEAWDRIHRAGATARVLMTLVDPETATRIAPFAANTDLWYQLVPLAQSELALRPTTARDVFADACAVMHLSTSETTRAPVSALAGELLQSLPGGIPDAVREALIQAKQEQPEAKQALFLALEAFKPGQP
jgi:hypothetical protein